MKYIKPAVLGSFSATSNIHGDPMPGKQSHIVLDNTVGLARQTTAAYECDE
jgi:hypothetical protein